MLTIGSLFSGIGGLELGLERAGLGPVVWQVEIDPFCRAVLEKHWPDVERFEDVREFNGRPADIVCGGFPCQDISQAGQKEGISGSQSGLWDEMCRVIGNVRPLVVVVENVADLAIRGLDQVLADLAACGFDALWFPVRAAELGAPHTRERIFVVAYANEIRPEAVYRIQTREPDQTRNQASWQGLLSRTRSGRLRMLPLAGLCGMDDQRPSKLDGDRIAALGNAVVPQVAEVVGHVVMALHNPCKEYGGNDGNHCG